MNATPTSVRHDIDPSLRLRVGARGRRRAGRRSVTADGLFGRRVAAETRGGWSGMPSVARGDTLLVGTSRGKQISRHCQDSLGMSPVDDACGSCGKLFCSFPRTCGRSTSVVGSSRLSMNATWSIPASRKNLQNSIKPACESVPRPSVSGTAASYGFACLSGWRTKSGTSAAARPTAISVASTFALSRQSTPPIRRLPVDPATSSADRGTRAESTCEIHNHSSSPAFRQASR